MEIVVQYLEQTISEIHIADWVDSFLEIYTSWQLSVSVGPLVFDTFHVPLIYYYDNFLMRAFIDFLEQIFVFLIYKNPL